MNLIREWSIIELMKSWSFCQIEKEIFKSMKVSIMGPQTKILF